MEDVDSSGSDVSGSTENLFYDDVERRDGRIGAEEFLESENYLIQFEQFEDKRYCSQISVREYRREATEYSRKELTKLQASPEFQFIMQSKEEQPFFNLLFFMIIMGCIALGVALYIERPHTALYPYVECVGRWLNEESPPALKCFVCSVKEWLNGLIQRNDSVRL